MTDQARREAVATGQLDIEFRGRVSSGLPIAPLAELRSLIATVDVPCWASGTTAAALHGFDGFRLKGPFHLTVERGHNVSRAGHHIHTTNSIELIDRAWAHGLPVLSPSRSLIHIAATASPEVTVAALDSAVRDGLTTDDFLHRRVSSLRASGRNGVRPMLAALETSEIARGGASWLEREFLKLVGAEGLPRPLTQQVLGRRGTTLIRVDARFPDAMLVVELLGYRWHRTVGQMLIDAQRMNRLQLAGFVVLQFTYREVVDTPDDVIATVREALGSAFATARE